MVMPEFNAELHDKTTREIGYKEGFTDGEQSGRAAGLAEAICDLLSDVCRLPDV